MSFKQLLNKVCVIESLTQTQNKNTGQKEDSFCVLYSGIKCRLRNRDTSEKISSEKQLQKATHAMYLEYLPLDINKHRVIVQGNIYKITGSVNLGGKEKYLCLYLERYA